jgi:hypothetical protein
LQAQQGLLGQKELLQAYSFTKQILAQRVGIPEMDFCFGTMPRKQAPQA